MANRLLTTSKVVAISWKSDKVLFTDVTTTTTTTTTTTITTTPLLLTCLPNPFSDYSLDWTSLNLSLVDLAVVCITYATFKILD